MANTINILLTDTFEQWRVKDNEIGAAIGNLDNLNLAGVSGDETVVSALNELRIDATNQAGWIGNMGTLYGGNLDLTSAVNDNKADIDTLATTAGIDLATSSLTGYNGTEVAAIDIFNAHFARLETNDTDISTINSNISSNDSDISAINGDIGTWANYNGGEADITSALNAIYAINQDLGADFVNATGDTMSGALVADGGINATTELLVGVAGSTTFTINNQQRIGVGVTPHASHKVDVNGNINASTMSIGDQDLDNRYILNSATSGTSEIGADMELSGNVTISQKLVIGSETVFDNAAFSFTEYVEDVAGNMFELNSESGGINASYSDSTGKITLAIADDGHNHIVSNIDNFSEEVQDIVGGMVSGNSESGISVVYQDGDGTLDFDVNDPTITLSGDVTGSATMHNLGSINIVTTVGSNNIDLGTDTTGSYVKKGATSGVGISGSVDSEGGTFTVTSNATSANTANAIVSRDASGNFIANDITVNNIGCNVVTAKGSVTVNADDGFSNIYMGDTDEGNRTIHCNSNLIGFLKQDNNWGAYCDDNGNWTAAGDITASGGDMYATNFHGKATTATYADLAENYIGDAQYEVGTVISLGGDWEVTQSTVDMDRRIIGVVSTAPAYLMNSEQQGEFVIPVALTGRVPCKVTGSIKAGDMLVSNGDGSARAEEAPRMGSVIGKALSDSDGTNIIEVVVGKL